MFPFVTPNPRRPLLPKGDFPKSKTQYVEEYNAGRTHNGRTVMEHQAHALQARNRAATVKRDRYLVEMKDKMQKLGITIDLSPDPAVSERLQKRYGKGGNVKAAMLNAYLTG